MEAEWGSMPQYTIRFQQTGIKIKVSQKDSMEFFWHIDPFSMLITPLMQYTIMCIGKSKYTRNVPYIFIALNGSNV